MTPENRNLILAVALSMAVLFGWQILVIQPELEKDQAQQALIVEQQAAIAKTQTCLLYTSPSPRDLSTSRMPSSA